MKDQGGSMPPAHICIFLRGRHKHVNVENKNIEQYQRYTEVKRYSLEDCSLDHIVQIE